MGVAENVKCKKPTPSSQNRKKYICVEFLLCVWTQHALNASQPTGPLQHLGIAPWSSLCSHVRDILRKSFHPPLVDVCSLDFSKGCEKRRSLMAQFLALKISGCMLKELNLRRIQESNGNASSMENVRKKTKSAPRVGLPS